MIYSLKRIIHNLNRHLPVYLLFVLQFAAGILILCSVLNVLVTLQKDLKANQEEMVNENVVEIITNKAYSFGSEIEATCMKQSMPVSYDMYLKLAEKYKENFAFQYAVETKLISGVVLNATDDSLVSMIPEVNVWFVNNEVFRDYFGISMEQDTMYAGENAYEVLCNLKEWADHPEQYRLMYSPNNVIWVENGEYTVAKKDAYKLAAMPPSEKTQIVSSEPDRSMYIDYEAEGIYHRPDLVDCIFIPMSALPVFEEFHDSLEWQDEEFKRSNLMMYYSTLLKAEYKNPDFKTELIPDILAFLTKETHLKERNWTVEFTLDKRQFERQKYAEDAKKGLSNYLIMSGSVLLVVVLGTTGLFLIFLYRRRKQMAVSIAFGSTRLRLFGELFAEIFVITGIGAALGLWALQFTEDFFKAFYVQTTFQTGCIVVSFLIAAFTALFTAILAFSGVGKIAPAKILKEV